MNDRIVAGQVRGIIADTLGVDEGELPDVPSQANLASWTSIRHMVLLVSLEEQFHVSFAMSEMATMTSLDEIVRVLSDKRAIGPRV